MEITQVYNGYCNLDVYGVIVWFTPSDGTPEFSVDVVFERKLGGAICHCAAYRDFAPEIAPHLEPLWDKYMRNPAGPLPPELQVFHVHEIQVEPAILEIAKAAARDYAKNILCEECNVS
jgi:hypothetical protein